METEAMTDSEIQEVRMARGAISREHGHDIHAVLEYYRSVQRELHGARTAALPGSAGCGQDDDETD
jgi:hypothetical protein